MAGALTATEFKHAVARFTRLSEKAKSVARSILVDGWTPEEAAEHYETSRQLTHQWATKVYEQFRPTGWVTETITLPAEVMDEVRKMETAARAQWESTLPPPRISRR